MQLGIPRTVGVLKNQDTGKNLPSYCSGKHLNLRSLHEAYYLRLKIMITLAICSLISIFVVAAATSPKPAPAPVRKRR